jgi:hypothetical protein
MAEFIRRIGQDIRRQRNLDAYAVAALAFAVAVLSVVADSLAAHFRWAVLLVGISVLVFRITLPDRLPGDAGDVLKDRSAFDDKPFPARLRSASELWVFAPSGINVLAPQHGDTIRTTLLDKPDGVVRIVVLDPAEEGAVRLATRQLDDSLDYPVQQFPLSLAATIERLRLMAAWQVRGSFKYRLLDHNPGFSLIAIDPGTSRGVVIVEFHGFHNQVTNTRMHIELTRVQSEQWYGYWIDQFEQIWQASRQSGELGERADGV